MMSCCVLYFVFCCANRQSKIKKLLSKLTKIIDRVVDKVYKLIGLRSNIYGSEVAGGAYMWQELEFRNFQLEKIVH